MMHPWAKYQTRGWSDGRVRGAGVMGQQWTHGPVGSPLRGMGDSACPPCECADTTVFYLVGGMMLLGILGTTAFLVAGGHEEAKPRRLSFDQRNLDRTQRALWRGGHVAGCEAMGSRGTSSLPRRTDGPSLLLVSSAAAKPSRHVTATSPFLRHCISLRTQASSRLLTC